MENSKSANSSPLKNFEEQRRSSLPFDFSHPINVKMQAINYNQQTEVQNSSINNSSVSQIGLHELFASNNSSSVGQIGLKELFEINPYGDGNDHKVNINKQPESNNSLGFGNETGVNSYQLRWNDHIPYFTSILQGLREQNELTDVTFACEDGIVVAHKLVLSSCSSYLRVLFGRLATPHPVIFLKNTPSSVVRHLMEFVYCGSVDVSEKDLVEVMSLGKSLQIQGLEKFRLPKEDVPNEKNMSCNVSDDKSTTKEIQPDTPLLPGEIREPPDYSMFNGQEIEFDAENNNIEGPEMKTYAKTIFPKTSNQYENQKPSPKPKQNQKRKRENGIIENTSMVLKKSYNEIKEENEQAHESQAMYFSNKGRLCYTPFIKKMVGKYYQDHGPHKSLKFVKEKFGMEIPDRTMRKWRTYYLDLQKSEIM